MGDLGFAVFLALISAGVGSRLITLISGKTSKTSLRTAQCVPLGLGALSLATLALGLMSRLDRTHLVGLLSISTIFAIQGGTRLLFGSAKLAFGHTRRILAKGSNLDRAILGMTLIGLVGCMLTAMIPVTDGDALCYHLQVPKVFLAKHQVSFEPDLHETIYPLVVELLYTIGLEFRGPVACRWVQLLFGLVFAGNVSLLAEPFLGRRSWWAGSIALLTPAVTNGMSAPLNDVALAAFGTAALAATMQAVGIQSKRLAILAGCFTGLAVGVKYPALVLFGLLAVTIFVCPRDEGVSISRTGIRDRLRLTAAFTFAALLVGSVWYLRAYANTGNPVFPYYRQVFGGSGLDEVLNPGRRVMPVTPFNVLTALFPMTLQPDRFESLAHQLGPLFLLFLPLLLIERPPGRVIVLVAIGYAFLTICVTQRQSTRFVLTALGPLSVGVAYLAKRWSLRRSPTAPIVIGIFVAFLGMQSAQAVGRSRHGLSVLVGTESAGQYLSRIEPTFRVGRWIERNLPKSARIIGQDHRGFYLPRDYTMELAHRRRTGLGRNGETPPQMIERLEASGFTHLLLCPPIPETAQEFDPTMCRLLDRWLARQDPVFREDLSDAEGVVRRYSIYSLQSARNTLASACDEPAESQR